MWDALHGNAQHSSCPSQVHCCCCLFFVVQVGGLSVLLHTDSIHISRLPRHLLASEQQLALLAEQLVPHNPAAAAACLAVLGQQLDGASGASPAGAAALGSRGSSPSWLGAGPLSVSGLQQPGESAQSQQQQQRRSTSGTATATQYGVWMSACCTYRLPDASKRFGLQQALSESSLLEPQQQVFDPAALQIEDEEADFLDWDADSAWHPWAQHRDPIHALELDAVWRDQRLTPAGASPPDDTSTATTAASAHAAGVDRASGALGAAQPSLAPGDMVALLADVASADVWVLHVLQHGYSSTPARSGRLGVKSFERHRRHVRVATAGKAVPDCD